MCRHILKTTNFMYSPNSLATATAIEELRSCDCALCGLMKLGICGPRYILLCGVGGVIHDLTAVNNYDAQQYAPTFVSPHVQHRGLFCSLARLAVVNVSSLEYVPPSRF